MNLPLVASGIALGGGAFLAVVLLATYAPGSPGLRILPDILLLPALVLVVFGFVAESPQELDRKRARPPDEELEPPRW